MMHGVTNIKIEDMNFESRWGKGVFSVYLNVQTGSEVHTTSCSVYISFFVFVGGKAARA